VQSTHIHLKPIPRWRYYIVLFSGLASTIGCGNGNRSVVSGAITFNGRPVGPGTITFQPVDARNVHAATGVSRFAEDGKYQLETGRQKDGLPPGDYVVIIDGDTTGNEREPPKKSPIPARYLKPEISQLRESVEPGAQEINFDLKP
jgi:hypothetical protein